MQCEFDTADSPTSIRHQLSLAAPPSVRLAPASGQLTAVQGEDAELGCEAGGRPPARVTWYKGRAGNEGSRSFHNYGEGPYWGLLLVESTNKHQHFHT